MAYINADVQTLENTIRSGAMTIDQGQTRFAECISRTENAISEDEKLIEKTNNTINVMEHAIDSLKEKSSELSKQIGDLRAEEVSAFRNGEKSIELSAQSMADYLEKERDAIDAQIKELNAEKNKLHDIKYELEQQKSSDISLLYTLKDDKIQFDHVCEEIQANNTTMGKRRDLILEH